MSVQWPPLECELVGADAGSACECHALARTDRIEAPLVTVPSVMRCLRECRSEAKLRPGERSLSVLQCLSMRCLYL